MDQQKYPRCHSKYIRTSIPLLQIFNDTQYVYTQASQDPMDPIQISMKFPGGRT